MHLTQGQLNIVLHSLLLWDFLCAISHNVDVDHLDAVVLTKWTHIKYQTPNTSLLPDARSWLSPTLDVASSFFNKTCIL
jgi:hypothetical protein